LANAIIIRQDPVSQPKMILEYLDKSNL